MSYSMSSGSSTKSSCLSLSGSPWAYESSLRKLKHEITNNSNNNNKNKRNNNSKISKLVLTDFDLDVTTTALIVQVLQNNAGYLNCLILNECTGHTGIIVTVAMSLSPPSSIITTPPLIVDENENEKELSSSSTTTTTNTTTNDQLQPKQHLKTLIISFGRLAIDASNPCMHSIGVGLQTQSHNLTELVLQSGSNAFFTLSSEAATSLELGLINNKTIQTFKLIGCRFAEFNCIRSLTRGIKYQNSKSIENFILKSCFISNGHIIDDSSLAYIISNGLQFNHKQLTTLDFSGNKCFHHSLIALGKLIDTSTTLQHLNLSSQCIENDNNDNELLLQQQQQQQLDEGMNEDGTATTNPNYEYVNLSLLCSSIARTKTLKSLELRFNKLIDNDIIYLATALRYNTSIKYVGLSSNKISNDGISLLAEQIPYMTTLTTLILTNNIFDNDGVISLVNALQYNHILQSVECDTINTRRTGISLYNRKLIQYHTDLNWAGRQLLLKNKTNHHNDSTTTTSATTISTTSPTTTMAFDIPSGLWPYILGRVCMLKSKPNPIERSANILYWWLREGPVLWERRGHEN